MNPQMMAMIQAMMQARQGGGMGMGGSPMAGLGGGLGGGMMNGMGGGGMMGMRPAHDAPVMGPMGRPMMPGGGMGQGMAQGLGGGMGGGPMGGGMRGLIGGDPDTDAAIRLMLKQQMPWLGNPLAKPWMGIPGGGGVTPMSTLMNLSSFPGGAGGEGSGGGGQ